MYSSHARLCVGLCMHCTHPRTTKRALLFAAEAADFAAPRQVTPLTYTEEEEVLVPCNLRRQMLQIRGFTQRLHSYWLLQLFFSWKREGRRNRYVFSSGGIFVLCVRVSRIFAL